MKAAVIYNANEAPKYEEFSDPVSAGENEILVSMRAVAIPNFEKGLASGKHYASSANTVPRIPVTMGVGEMKDGTRFFGVGIGGVLAEKALFNKAQMIRVPDGLDSVTAAAIPNAVVGSALALLFRANLKSGDVVLINGATGFTGKLAVQLAKHYGAKKVIATGRNQEQLEELLELGADEVISLKGTPNEISRKIRVLHEFDPIGVVLDYTWGKPAELILNALQGKGKFTPATRFVTVGSIAGDSINLSSAILRSSGLSLMGSGVGSLPADALRQLFSVVLPDVYALAAAGKLKIDTVSARLADVETDFYKEVAASKRLVFEI